MAYPSVPARSRFRPAQHRLAVTALVLGIIGLVFSFVPIIGIIAWPLCLGGIVFGIVALASPRAGGTGMAVAGLVTSALGLLICIAYAAVFLVVL